MAFNFIRDTIFPSQQPWYSKLVQDVQGAVPTQDQIQKFISQPAVAANINNNDWFSSPGTQSFQDKLPSSVSVIAFVCALGFLQCFVTKSATTDVKKLSKIYFAASQLLVAAISFMGIVDRPHLQQIAATGLLCAMNIFSLMKSFNFSQLGNEAQHLFQNLRPSQQEKQQQKSKTPADAQLYMKKQEEAASLYSEDFKDNQHSQQQQSHQPPQSKEQSQQVLPQSHTKSQISEHTEKNVIKLGFFWVKIAIYSLISAFPVLLANSTHISRSKKSLFNIFSWLSSSEYSMLNPFSLSLINWIGIMTALVSIALLHNSTPIAKKVNAELGRYLTWWSSNVAYTTFSIGLFLTTFAFNRPFSSFFSLLAPIGSMCFTFIKMMYSYQQNQKENAVPSLVKQIYRQPISQQIMKSSRNMLPFVY